MLLELFLIWNLHPICPENKHLTVNVPCRKLKSQVLWEKEKTYAAQVD